MPRVQESLRPKRAFTYWRWKMARVWLKVIGARWQTKDWPLLRTTHLASLTQLTSDNFYKISCQLMAKYNDLTYFSRLRFAQVHSSLLCYSSVLTCLRRGSRRCSTAIHMNSFQKNVHLVWDFIMNSLHIWICSFVCSKSIEAYITR